jgi:hypothetical protein
MEKFKMHSPNNDRWDNQLIGVFFESRDASYFYGIKLSEEDLLSSMRASKKNR